MLSSKQLEGRNQLAKSFLDEQMTLIEAKYGASTPGIEPGIFRSVGGRLIHWAMRNEAQEDFGGLDDKWFEIAEYVALLELSVRRCALPICM